MNRFQPGFTTLLDWLEGRLSPEESAHVAEAVAIGGPEITEAVAWIEEFLEASHTLKLATPPPELGDRLRAAFTDRVTLGGAASFTEATLLYDDHLPRAASGMRRSTSNDVTHLVFGSDLGRLVIDIEHTPAGTVDIRGFLSVREGAGDPRNVELSFMQRGTLRRATRPGGDGSFEVCGAPEQIDELWVSRGNSRVRASLPTGRR